MNKDKKYQPDKKDKAILNVLYRNSRLSCREISRRTGIPVMTVLKRMKRMEEEGAILEYTIRVNPLKLGFLVRAYVLVGLDYRYINKLKLTQQDVAEEIIKLPEVSVADLVTGPERDILLKLKAGSIEDLNEILDRIRLINGVHSTDTRTILYESRKATLAKKDFRPEKVLFPK